jgi:outer membrane receptor protein involved in Fe transport
MAAHRRTGLIALALSSLLLAPLESSLAADGDAEATAQTEDRAEPAAPASTSAARRKAAGAIEEITITARKREESLQATPIAVTAFSATDLQDQDVRQVSDINGNVPNLNFDQAIGSSSSARISLRGIGNGDPISSDDPGVGVYVDGVYLARAQGALLTVSDIERVEVLRGPQGTLFGKNTVGGAISIVSKKPDTSGFSGNTELRVGNYGRFDTRLSLNLPLVPERAAARLSFATATRDGFTKNKGSGSDLGDDKLLAGRAQFLVLPSDDLELSFSFDHSIENRKPQGGKCVVTDRGQVAQLGSPSAQLFSAFVGLPTGAGAVPFTRGDIPTLLGLGPGSIAIDAGLNPGGDGVLGGTVNPQVSSAFGSGQGDGGGNQFLDRCAQDAGRDERSVASDLSFQRDYLTTFGANGTVSWDVSETVTVKSITAWRRQENDNRRDFDFTDLPFAGNSADFGRTQQDQVSQEFQLLGRALDDRLNYVVGLYGFTEKNQDRGGLSIAPGTQFTFPVVAVLQNRSGRSNAARPGNPNPIDTDAFDAPSERQALLTATLLGLPALAVTDTGAMPLGAADVQGLQSELQGLLGDAADLALPIQVDTTIPDPTSPSGFQQTIGPSLIVPTSQMQQILKVNNLSYAGYAQGTYDLTPRLALTTGLRFTHERKRVETNITAVTSGLVGSNLVRAGVQDFSFDRSERFTSFSPMLNLSFQATDDALVYGTYSRGFKSGGFNGRAVSDIQTGKVDDEELTAYEVGLKSSLLDDRLVFNVAAFWNIYEDIQLTIPMGANAQFQAIDVNAGEADIRGAEIEARARVLPNLELSTAIGITNARYTEFDDPDDPQADDRRLPNTPNYTLNFTLGYQLPLGDLGDVRMRTSYTHRGKSGTDVADSEVLRRGKNGLLEAQVAFALADGKTEVVLFGNNLLDREFVINGINFDESFGHAVRFYNDPRTYGLEIRRQF